MTPYRGVQCQLVRKKCIFYSKSVFSGFRSVYFVFNTPRCVGMEVDDYCIIIILSGKKSGRQILFFHDDAGDGDDDALGDEESERDEL